MLADAIRLFLFPAMMAYAACGDLLSMTISNRITLILAGSFFALAWLSGIHLTEILMHVGAALAVLIVAFVFFARSWIGGGDAKLAAVAALWFGFDHLLHYLLYASLLGGVLTIAIIQFRLAPLPQALAGQQWLQRLHRIDGGVPYGIALAIAALLIYPDTFWMKTLGQ